MAWFGFERVPASGQREAPKRQETPLEPRVGFLGNLLWTKDSVSLAHSCPHSRYPSRKRFGCAFCGLNYLFFPLLVLFSLGFIILPIFCRVDPQKENPN